jgi:hypothetical protein
VHFFGIIDLWVDLGGELGVVASLSGDRPSGM